MNNHVVYILYNDNINDRTAIFITEGTKPEETKRAMELLEKKLLITEQK